MVHAGRKVSDVTTSTPEPLAGMRREYAGELLEEALAPDWPTQFGRWLATLA